MKAVPLAIAVTLAIAACTAAVPASSPPEQMSRMGGPSPESRQVPPPILTEEQAIQVALRLVEGSAPGITGGSDIRNPRARLMTLEEYEERLSNGRSYGDRSIPVWVVTMEGEWSPAGIAAPASPLVTSRVYTHGMQVINARTGEAIKGGRSFEPLDLDAVQELDSEAFSTYPLKVSLSYAKDLADFPVSQPAFLPGGFSLAGVWLELSDPLKDLILPEWFPHQTVIQEYADGRGNVIQLAQRGGRLPDSILGANKTTVLHNEAWESQAPGGPTWLAWRAHYPGHYVTHTLYSPSGAVGLDVLHQIAETLLPGELSLTTSTPAVPITAPTAVPTATPAPHPPSAGVHTTADLIAHLSTYPQEYLCFLDDQTVVRFAYPSPILDWAGFAFIDHIPTVSSVTLRHPYEVARSDGTVEKEAGAENLHGYELMVRRHYSSEDGEAKLEAVLASEDLVGRIVSGPEECHEAIPEPVAREAIRQIWLGGPPEAEPGFGGLFLDRDDNSIAYVYMLDTSQQEAAEEAARKVLGARRFQEIREVRVLQGQYSMSQLSRWYDQMRDAIWSVGGISMTDLNEGKNRIEIVMRPRPNARSEMEAALASAGVPLEAVNIHVGCPMGDSYQPPPVPDDPIYQSIELWVEAPAEIRAGETVPLTLKVKNISESPVRLEYGLGHDFVITRSDGGKVWNRRCEVSVVPAILMIAALDPGEEFTHEAEWKQWDNQGEMAHPGQYMVYGVFAAIPDVATEPRQMIVLE